MPTRSHPGRAGFAALALVGWIGSGGCQPGSIPGQAAPPLTLPRPDAPAGRPGPSEPPARPFELPRPPEPTAGGGPASPGRGDASALAGSADDLARRGEYREAARLEDLAIRAGGGSEYRLACRFARAGDVEAALYWLQEAALGDGVDPTWAAQDPDLAPARADPRWPAIVPFLKRCNAYWASTGHCRTALVVPGGYRVGTPIGVVVCLHGQGDRPEGLVEGGAFQGAADELNLAFVGVSGTIPTGRRSFVWSEDHGLDAAQVDRCLASLGDRLTVKPGPRIALGFSQGGQVAFEVAFARPEQYRGAVVISPGAIRRFYRLSRLAPTEENRRQNFVCLCGSGEGAGNLGFARDDAAFAESAGARVELRIAEGQARHALPADFAESLATWVRFVEGKAEKPE